MYSGSLGVMQPSLIASFGLTLTQAGVLGGTLSFSSSVMQPLYGILADRFRSRLFTALAPAVAGILISTLGFAGSYGWLLLMIFAGSAGIASFHPQAASNVAAGAPRNPGQTMAIFISAGTLGLALGPAVYSLVISHRGIQGAWIVAIPGVIATLLMLGFLPQPPARTAGRNLDFGCLRVVWKPLARLFFLVFTRSAVQVTFSQFLPLYLHQSRGFSLSAASYALAVFMAGATLGGLAGGNLAGRFGERNVILWSAFWTTPLLAAFLYGHGVWSMVALTAGGIALLFTNPVNVVMAQRLAPQQSNTVSALMMGFAWGSGGLIFIPLAGKIADHYSLQAAFSGLILLPVIAFILAWKLPK